MEQQIIKKFWKYTDKSKNCWQWLAFKNKGGYGRLGYGKKKFYAHRLSYKINKGEIPDGLQIDHLCKNRGCVNPNHLEAVTQKENILRGESIFAKEARQTHCINNHKLSEENIYIYDNHRKCKICSQSYSLNRYYNFKLALI